MDDGNDIQVQAYYDRTNRLESNFGEIRNTFDVDFLQRLRLPARQQISWGLGARVDPVNNTEVVSGLTFVPNRRTDYLFTAFVQDEIGLVDRRLSLTRGNESCCARISREAASNWNRAPAFSGHRCESTIRVGGIYARAAHAVRCRSEFQSLRLHRARRPEAFPFSHDSTPIQTFASEQLNGYELGYRRLLGRNLYVDVASFYNHYHDLFSEDLTGQAFLETSAGSTHLLLPAQFRNGLLGTTKGVEIAPEWRPTELLAAARFVLVSAHECGQSPRIRRCRNRAGHPNVQSAASR